MKNINNEHYDINPDMFELLRGYNAVIDGVTISIQPNQYEFKLLPGPKNELVNTPVLLYPGCLLVNGERTQSGKLENPTDKQLFELVTAKVLILNPDQDKSFRKKFFNID